MKLVFVTNNLNKLEEIRAAVDSKIKIIGLKEIGIDEEIPETASTLEGNAIQKAKYIFDKVKIPCFADDTGLEVKVLNHRPGVLSARYAGEDCNPENNMKKLLSEMSGLTNREAIFRTVIAFIYKDQVYCFEGKVNGDITTEKRGNMGFGYDPIFLPNESKKTFAQLTLDEKNKISHRSKALQKFTDFLHSEILNK
jgi:XTP/dITP diphosphohydrolase